jgi:signal transduction histidine kinase
MSPKRAAKQARAPSYAKRGQGEELLHRAYEQLEQRVLERTAELEAASRYARNTNRLLALFAQKISVMDYLQAVLGLVQEWSGCEAVGIRITDEQGEIPYQCWTGFDPAFVEQENRLSLQRDACCCLRAISQDLLDTDRELLTPGGSYRCDDQTAFLNQLPADKQGRYRGTCAQFGFVSVAVIPLRYHNQILGALHLADSRRARFAPATVEFLESMAPLIAEAVHRFQTEAELARHRNQLELLVKQRTSELITANARLELEISERKRAQETLHQIAQELQRSNRELEQFAYVASHDLQEPLRAVAGYVRLLERRFPTSLDPKAREYVAGAVAGATRMENLITGLLAFSRIGTQSGEFAPNDFNLLLEEALHNLSAVLEESHAEVTCNRLPALSADSIQMVQIFQNLIGNAVKFRREEVPRIHIGAQQNAGRWVFAVKDNGIGIEPHYFERIFQIFQRLHTRKHYPGTGIGLAICKKIVERHRGAIWVESEPGQGSTFYFSIPEKPVIREANI